MLEILLLEYLAKTSNQMKWLGKYMSGLEN